MFLFTLIRKLISGTILLIVVISLWALGRTWFVAHDLTVRKADAIVVMGAAQLDGRPGDVLKARLEESVRIYKKDLAPRIYTLGSGAPGDRFTEAAAGKRWLTSQGIKKSAIISIPQGRDSYSSITALAKKVNQTKIRDIIIVTDPYHCLRSTTMANDQGFVATCSPTQRGVGSLESASYRYWLREAGAYLAYITLGRRGIHISDHVAFELWR